MSLNLCDSLCLCVKLPLNRAGCQAAYHLFLQQDVDDDAGQHYDGDRGEHGGIVEAE